MKRFSKYAGAVVLVILTVALLVSLLVYFLPSPTPEQRATFERWQVDQADQVNRAGEAGGETKE